MDSTNNELTSNTTVPGIAVSKVEDSSLLTEATKKAVESVLKETTIPGIATSKIEDSTFLTEASKKAVEDVLNNTTVPGIAVSKVEDSTLLTETTKKAIQNVLNDATVPGIAVSKVEDSSLLTEATKKAVENILNDTTVPGIATENISPSSSLVEATQQATQEALNSINNATPNINNATLNNDGSLTFNNQKLTNEQLSEVFDYSKYEDATLKSRVEGIFKSKTFSIGKVTYPTTLNEYGNLVSVDGKSILTREEIEKLMGPEEYKALVCKTTKTVTITDGKVVVSDNDKEVTLDLENSKKEKELFEAKEKETTDKKKNTKEKKKKKSSGSVGGYAGVSSSAALGAVGGSGSGGSIGGATGSYGSSSYGGSYSDSGSYSSSYTDSSSSSTSDSSNSSATVDTSTDSSSGFETAVGNNEVILVDFDGLTNTIDQLKSQKEQLASISGNYRSQISSLAGSSAWEGADKDYFITQKNTYSDNFDDVVTTLEAFINCLETYKENYMTLENTLAGKTIS